MGINPDGTVASVANDLDLATLYTYDDLGRVSQSTRTASTAAGRSTTVNNRFVRLSAGPTSWTEYTLDGSDGRYKASTS